MNSENEPVIEIELEDSAPAEDTTAEKKKRRRRTRRILTLVLVLILLLILAAGVVFLLKQHKINSTVSITVALNSAEELPLLDGYPNLQYADLSGSRCYDDILAYQATHPQVTVVYSVLADGVEIPSTSASLDWSGHSVAALTEQAAYLPQLQQIELGSTEASAEELNALCAAYPGLNLHYTVNYKGREYDCAETTLDLSSLTDAQAEEAAELAAKLPLLKNVTLPQDGSLSLENYAKIHDANPDAFYTYSFELYGLQLSTETKEIFLKNEEIGNEGADQLRILLRCLPKLEELRVDRCGIDDEVMAQLRDEYPDVHVAWRIFFWQFSTMTDAERIWAIGGLTDEYTEPLKYCTEVKYLDLGHNGLVDISFLHYMPKIEVLILSMNAIEDISVLAELKELEYLELTLCQVKDITPLASCTKLKHLEMSQVHSVNDLSPLDDLDLERFYMMYSHNANLTDQFTRFQELHPNCATEFGSWGKEDPYNESDWRYSYFGGYAPRYEKLREQIGYDDPNNEAYLNDWLEPAESYAN